jgi:hypothetical protein
MLVRLYAQRMLKLACAQAKAVPKGHPMAYKRSRYLREALYWRRFLRRSSK